MINRVEIKNREKWDSAIADLPGFSILQTWEWGEIKQKFGWQPSRYLWVDEKGKPLAAAQLLLKALSVPLVGNHFKTVYIPQGPLLDWANKELRTFILSDIRELTVQSRAVFIKIDPEVITSFSETISQQEQQYKNAYDVVSQFQSLGYQFSPQQIQFRNTAWIYLDNTEEYLLAQMKQKSRYNIRLAGRKGVTVRQGSAEDIQLLYQMYLETSIRDGFIIRPEDYYQEVWTKFMNAGMGVPLVAEVDQQPVAGLMLFHFAGRSWYLYGMSTSKHRDKMPNYLLQWEAIRMSKNLGCKIYDLWGAPDEFSQSDSMWGVYRFKKGLGAKPVQRIGAYDLPLKKITYKIFIDFVPRIQAVTRRIRKAQQLQELN